MRLEIELYSRQPQIKMTGHAVCGCIAIPQRRAKRDHAVNACERAIASVGGSPGRRRALWAARVLAYPHLIDECGERVPARIIKEVMIECSLEVPCMQRSPAVSQSFILSFPYHAEFTSVQQCRPEVTGLGL